jgi:hypothetical protein
LFLWVDRCLCDDCREMRAGDRREESRVPRCLRECRAGGNRSLRWRKQCAVHAGYRSREARVMSDVTPLLPLGDPAQGVCVDGVCIVPGTEQHEAKQAEEAEQ